MIYGYARISTKQQSIDRQIRNIKAQYPTSVIFQEAFTGTKFNRPEWNKLYKKVKKGDTLVFDSVSRMSRDAEEGFKIYEELYNKGVELVFIKEPHINTSMYRESVNNGLAFTGNEIADMYIDTTNKVMMILAEKQIKSAFEQAQKEVDDLHQRTKEGIETARINGKQIGQKKGTKLTTKKSIKAKEEILKHSKDFNGSLDDITCMKIVGLSRNTYYKYKKELKEEM